MNRNGINIHFFVMLLMVLAGYGSNNIKLKVLFEQQPDNMGNQHIYYKEYQIGKASAPKLMQDGQYFAVNILINPDYKNLLHSNTTFYVEDKRITSII
jgi:hypothetical protein